MTQQSATVAMAVGMAVFLASSAAWALEPCVVGSGSCAEVRVADAEGNAGDLASVSVSFVQGPAEGPAGEGNDDVAAIAFTLGIGDQLSLDCDGGVLASEAVTPGAEIAGDFAVVVENAECSNRDRCLCPQGGEQRDSFVNVVVYGPKDLPAEGPVEIPRLPDSGDLLTLNLRIAGGTPADTVIPLHIFNETDGGAVVKPQFGANLSIGDQAAIDQTADRGADRSRVSFVDGSVLVREAVAVCVGDCSGDEAVSISELVKGVNIALELKDLVECPAFDKNHDGRVSISELVEAVGNALNDCA